VGLPDMTGFMGGASELDSLSLSFGVAQYRASSLELLKAKIRQYPHGTKFVLRDGPFEANDQRKLEDDLIAVFKSEGMTLERVNH
jgi:hypothetical protein